MVRTSFDFLGHARFDIPTVTGDMEGVDPPRSRFLFERLEAALFMGQVVSDVF